MATKNNERTTCSILYYLNEQRYVLSVILSYLNENEGTSLLITNRTWTRHILPMFQLPDHLITILPNKSVGGSVVSSSSSSSNNVPKIKQSRHRFIIMPVQDSRVLLSRLNTRRLAARIRSCICQKDDEIVHNDGIISIREDDRGKPNCLKCSYYPLNLTTDEIAWVEWNQVRLDFMTSMEEESKQRITHDPQGPQSLTTSNSQTPFRWKAKLELLRYRTPPPTYTIPKHNPTIQPPPKILPQTTLLTSYPRSGNTLLRNLLERITNFVTGSDTRPDRTLSKSLALDHDLVGEGIVNSKVTPVIKTHFPERRGYMKFGTSRIILLVRNPYDAIDSYWNMCCTNTHTESVVEDIYDLYKDKFNDLAKHEMITWLQFMKYWLTRGNTKFAGDDFHGNIDNCDNKNNTIGGMLDQRPSLLVVRFEDLILRTEFIMEQVISFMLYGDTETELHPFWKWRIRLGLDLAQSASLIQSSSHHNDDNNDNDKTIKGMEKRVNTSQLGSYKPRSEKENGFASIGKSIRKGRYSEEMLSSFQEIAQREEFQMNFRNEKLDILKLFDFDVSTQNFPNNFSSEGYNWSFEKYMQQINHLRDRSLLRVNVGPELRSQSSPFGRKMTQWRKSETDDDRNPFPTKEKP